MRNDKKLAQLNKRLFPLQCKFTSVAQFFEWWPNIRVAE